METAPQLKQLGYKISQRRKTNKIIGIKSLSYLIAKTRANFKTEYALKIPTI